MRGRLRWLVAAVGVLALGLIGGAWAAPAASNAGSSVVTKYYGPIVAGTGQNLRFTVANFDSQSRVAQMTGFNDAGSIVFSSSVTVAPEASWDWYGDNVDGGMWIRTRSSSALMIGSLEVIDDATGQPACSDDAISPGGLGSRLAGGPVTMSDELREVALVSNVTSSSRMVTITFYDSAGTVLEQSTQTLGARRTMAKGFPTTVEGPAVHYVVSASETSPALMGSTIGLNFAGQDTESSPAIESAIGSG